MIERAFWNVDTQVDFIDPAGRLHVSGAEELLPNLERLTQYARAQGLLIVASMDDHLATDEEISEHADFHRTFPPHCMRGTEGREQVSATRCMAPAVIENRPCTGARLRELIAGRREIVLLKNRFDVFTQPNANLLIELLAPRSVVVYGVALDVCVYHAVEGLLARGDLEIQVVRDAVRAIDPARGEAILSDWARRGVALLETAAVVGC